MKAPERARRLRLCGLFPALALLAACQVTDVENPNAPDPTRVFGTAAELEAHVASAFHDWYRAETGYLSVPGMSSAASFQQSTWAV